MVNNVTQYIRFLIKTAYLGEVASGACYFPNNFLPSSLFSLLSFLFPCPIYEKQITSLFFCPDLAPPMAPRPPIMI